MKKAVIILTSLMIVSVTCFATVPSGPKLAEYFSKRYVSFNYSGAIYDIDFQQVQRTMLDHHGHVSEQYAPNNKGSWGKPHLWVFFKDGSWMMTEIAHTSPNIVDSWKAYRDFLQANPQFLSIP